jgi:hypothetical protein
MAGIYKIVRIDTGEVVRVIGRLRDLKAKVKWYDYHKGDPDVKSLMKSINEALEPKGLRLIREDPPSKIDISGLLEE